MQIEVRGLSKSFGTVSAVHDVSFSIEKGKFIGLLGPSGGGKTTILRMLAGLETPTGGEISFSGQDVSSLPPQQRGIGFVFQNYALFKHMTVFDNIAFGLKVQKKSKAEIAERVHELLELVGLSGTEKRYPHQLSGGQRQRVAFARALAPEPQLLLLDEPFAAIDAKVRKELRTWLKAMISRLGITSIFVTHDQEEAVEIADEIMIINQGRLEQKGTPWEIYKHPETPFVATFIGETNALDNVAFLKGFVGDRIAADWQGARALVRPEAVEVCRVGEAKHGEGAEWGVVRGVHFRGTAWQVEVEVGPYRLLAQRSLEQDVLQVGEQVQVLIHRVHVVEGDRISVVDHVSKELLQNEKQTRQENEEWKNEQVV
ncbi:MAG: ABC transporter ATP-binding protein [Tumebacillaceae bacterium]